MFLCGPIGSHDISQAQGGGQNHTEPCKHLQPSHINKFCPATAQVWHRAHTCVVQSAPTNQPHCLFLLVSSPVAHSRQHLQCARTPPQHTAAAGLLSLHGSPPHAQHCCHVGGTATVSGTAQVAQPPQHLQLGNASPSVQRTVAGRVRTTSALQAACSSSKPAIITNYKARVHVMQRKTHVHPHTH